MALTHTDTNIDRLNINKFSSKDDFDEAVNQGLIGANEISIILEGDKLSELDDVNIVLPQSNQILKYNSTTHKWENSDDLIDLPNNYMTLNTVQRTSVAKAIFGTDYAFGSDSTQKNLLAVISDSNSIAGNWIGRMTVGAKNKTFIMGTYGGICVLGAHAWTNAQQGTGAAWEDVYINPDGNKGVFIGGSPINGKKSLMVLQNVNANTTGSVKINRSSDLTDNFKEVACWDDNVSKFNNDAGYLTSASVDDLTDTDITNATDGQVLTYDGTAGKWVNSTAAGGGADLAESITYSALVTLKNANNGAGNLVPGKMYRITDYVAKTTQTNTRSINTSGLTGYHNAFDLVVFATSANTLDCCAMAVLHSGDTYFSGVDLSKWQIWYDINNDTNKYAWADSSNGKGVIYRMIDDYGNDCPFDFKNIQFKRKVASGGVYNPTSGSDTWVYAFTHAKYNYDEDFDEYTFDGLYDGSIDSRVQSDPITATQAKMYGNIISPYQFLNSVYDEYTEEYSYIICYKLPEIVMIGRDCYGNVFENDCTDITFGGSCMLNYFHTGCSNIKFVTSIGNPNNSGYGCSGNMFSSSCVNITLGDYCDSNSFGNGNGNIVFGNSCYYNEFGNMCQNIKFGNYCQKNKFGANCMNITFGNGSQANPTQYGNYIQSVVAEGGTRYVKLYTPNDNGSSSRVLKNVYIAQGHYYTSSTILEITEIARGLNYRTTVGRRTSDGQKVIYNEDDLPATITNPTNGQVLTYDGTAGRWVNGNAGGGADLSFDNQYVEVANASMSCNITFNSNKRGCCLVNYTDSDTPVSGNLQINVTSGNWFDNYIVVHNNISDPLNVAFSILTDPNSNTRTNMVVMEPNAITVEAGGYTKICVTMYDYSSNTSFVNEYSKDTLVVITNSLEQSMM